MQSEFLDTLHDALSKARDSYAKLREEFRAPLDAMEMKADELDDTIEEETSVAIKSILDDIALGIDTLSQAENKNFHLTNEDRNAVIGMLNAFMLGRQILSERDNAEWVMANHLLDQNIRYGVRLPDANERIPEDDRKLFEDIKNRHRTMFEDKDKPQRIRQLLADLETELVATNVIWDVLDAADDKYFKQIPAEPPEALKNSIFMSVAGYPDSGFDKEEVAFVLAENKQQAKKLKQDLSDYFMTVITPEAESGKFSILQYDIQEKYLDRIVAVDRKELIARGIRPAGYVESTELMMDSAVLDIIAPMHKSSPLRR